MPADTSRLAWTEATPDAVEELMLRQGLLSRAHEEAETTIRWGSDGVTVWTCIGADLRGLLRRAGSALRRFASDAHGVRLDFDPSALRDAAMVAKNLDDRSGVGFPGLDESVVGQFDSAIVADGTRVS